MRTNAIQRDRCGFTRWGAIIGCAASVLFAIHALGRLSHMSDLGGPVGRIGAMAIRVTTGLNRRP